MKRKYVSVVTLYDLAGNISPLFIVWDNGVKYKIDRVIQRCPASLFESGGSGIRYTCLFNGQRRYLFLDENKWYIESQS
ncbi:MAG: hypothetical protein GX675_00705 [Erysipelotrichaceae bacterium]|nr:hypothetical protein [Erysipelotrichaceae bacterium]